MPIKIDLPVTITERRKAAKIIKAIRDTMSRPKAAQLLGISSTYVTCTENMTKFKTRHELAFVTPHAIIRQVIDWSNKNTCPM